MKFEGIFGTCVVIGLFALALFALINNIQQNNDAEQPLIENKLVGDTYADLNNTIGSLEGTSSTQKNLFFQEKPAIGFGAIVLYTIVSVGKTFGNIIFTLLTLVIKVPLIVLGVDPAITSMLISFLTISVVIALWIVYKFGG